MTRYTLYLDDCLAWMEKRESASIHAIVTDPPYGLKEYTSVEKEKASQWEWRRVADSAVI